MAVVGWVRVNRTHPCPVCARTHYCSVSPDGGLVYCTRTPSERPSPAGTGWVHRLGAGVPRGPEKRNGHAAVKQNGASPTTRYAIVGGDGELAAIHCRIDLPDGDKRIWWERPDGTKGLGGRKPAELPLYGAETLVALAEQAVVFVCEGEKAADALVGLELVAVGTVTGADTIPDDDALRDLVGFNVVLWPDNDAKGVEHMHRIAQRLLALGAASADTRMLDWPEAPPKGDAADFVAAGLGVEELRALYGAALAVALEPSTEVDKSEAPAPVDELHLTDMGNADRLVARHGPDLRFCGPWRRWVVWGGETWSEHGDDRVQERAKETVRAIYEEGIAATSPERATAVWKHAQRSESAGRVHAMIELARSAPPLAIQPDDLDRDPGLLNCANGTIDLRTGTLAPFSREDLMTKRSPALFDTTATCPTWLAFLEQIFAGDAEMIGFMQRAAGYCLSGSTVERVLFILFGAGRNGKSTFLEVLRYVLGDYASGTPASTIMSQRNKGIPNDIARLKGARFVSASETSEAAEIDEAFIKVATGGDTITARFLNAEFFDFRPQFKIWIATNHKPTIKGTDPAVWDRIRLTPFTVRIPEDQLDKGLRDKLIAEADGILQWMLAGCLEWQRIGGLGEPDKVRAATEEYRLNENMFGAFLTARCDVDQPGTAIRSNALAGALYATYKEWAKQAGEEAMSQRRFGDRLREQGFQAGKNNQDQRVWRGLQLLSTEEQAAADA